MKDVPITNALPDTVDFKVGQVFYLDFNLPGNYGSCTRMITALRLQRFGPVDILEIIRKGNDPLYPGADEVANPFISSGFITAMIDGKWREIAQFQTHGITFLD